MAVTSRYPSNNYLRCCDDALRSEENHAQKSCAVLNSNSPSFSFECMVVVVGCILEQFPTSYSWRRSSPNFPVINSALNPQFPHESYPMNERERNGTSLRNGAKDCITYQHVSRKGRADYSIRSSPSSSSYYKPL